MHKKIMALALTLAISTSLAAAPAYALSYTVDGAKERTFGPITSVDIDIPAADSAADLSKNAAYAPPGFGTEESYLPNRAEKLIDLRGTDGTTSVTVGPGSLDSSATNSNVTVGADGFPTVDGGNSIGSSSTVSQPTTKFTAVTSDSYNASGKLGTVEIPALGINYTITEGTSNLDMKYGAGHVKETSIWDGNVCLAGHNRGVKNNFGKIHTLKVGDTIKLNTVYGTRSYQVSSVNKIAESDLNCLGRSTENMITLITCVADQSSYRYIVTGYEV